MILNPSRFESTLFGRGTSSLSNTDRTIAMNIEPAVAADASNALSLSPVLSASNIIMNEEIIAYRNRAHGVYGSLPNRTDFDRTINPSVTKCAQSDKCPFCLPSSPLISTTIKIVNSSQAGSKPPMK